MRVAVVAGPDPGHSFPAIALCLKLLAAGDEPTLAYLHATFESSPERREEVAEAVAQFTLAHPPRPADRVINPLRKGMLRTPDFLPDPSGGGRRERYGASDKGETADCNKRGTA